ncbi:hypothetical protein HC928_11275 [bacterium]|nr:hypothetical protein [bacterium]
MAIAIGSNEQALQISAKLTSLKAGAIVSVYRAGADGRYPLYQQRYSEVTFKATLHVLSCRVEVPSLPQVTLPQYLIRESLFASAGRVGFGATDFVSQGKWLATWVRCMGGQWTQIGRVLMLNEVSSRFHLLPLLELFNPYRQPYHLGYGDEIGVSVTNTGNGFLSVSDSVSIWGSATELLSFADMERYPASNSLTVNVTDASQVILGANSRRTEVNWHNSGSEDVWVKFGANASASDYSVPMPPNHFASNSSWQGAIAVACSPGKTSTLRVTEVSR